KKNPLKAVEWIRKAAEQDHAGAQYQLGIMYRDGMGVSNSESEAIKWLRLASSWGISKAQRDLDALLRKQLLASEDAFSGNPELSDPESQFALGLMYVDGKGVDKDAATAAQWFLKAARQEHLEAQFRLGEMYKDGIGVETDTKEAKLWLSKAAGKGLEKASKALQDILRAEEQSILARELQSLKNSPIYPYLLSANQGDASAKYKVGIMYVEGQDAPQDTREGIRWLQSAANNDHTLAQLELGKIYLQGAPAIEKDYLTAMRWLEKAAQNGDANAQYHLGNMYRKGLGTSRSNAEAIKWFRLAAKQGHKEARKILGGCKVC
ncbi:SEL1-like repeat protein, partial [Kaarinaea lacus]